MKGSSGTFLCRFVFKNVFVILTFFNRNIIFNLRNAFVCRTDNFSVIGKLFEAVGTPANHTGDRKDRCEELRRQIQHTVYKSAVEVHVGFDTFVDLAFFGNDLWCKRSTIE